jgi:hypothetical protein
MTCPTCNEPVTCRGRRGRRNKFCSPNCKRRNLQAVSVSQAVYRRLAAASAAAGKPMTWLVAKALEGAW